MCLFELISHLFSIVNSAVLHAEHTVCQLKLNILLNGRFVRLTVFKLLQGAAYRGLEPSPAAQLYV